MLWIKHVNTKGRYERPNQGLTKVLEEVPPSADGVKSFLDQAFKPNKKAPDEEYS